MEKLVTRKNEAGSGAEVVCITMPTLIQLHKTSNTPTNCIQSVFGSLRDNYLIFKATTVALRYKAFASSGRDLLIKRLVNEPRSFELVAQSFQELASVRYIQADII